MEEVDWVHTKRRLPPEMICYGKKNQWNEMKTLTDADVLGV